MPKPIEQFENVVIPELGGLTLAQFREKLREVEGYRAKIRALFTFPLTRYTAEDRQANGVAASFSRENEELAYLAVLDGADIAPGTIADADLDDKDGGSDPTAFETDLQRARVEAAKLARKEGEALSQLGFDLNDTGISLGLAAKQLFSVLYGVLKPSTKTNAKLKSALAEAIDFFKAISRRNKGTETKPT
jgi:hypothetical protein